LFGRVGRQTRPSHAKVRGFSFQFSLRILGLRFLQFDPTDYSRPAPFRQWHRHRTIRHDASLQPYARPGFAGGTGNCATLGDGALAFASWSNPSLRRSFCPRLLRSGGPGPAAALSNAPLGSDSDTAGVIYSVSAARPHRQHTRDAHSYRHRHQLPVRNRQPLG